MDFFLVVLALIAAGVFIERQRTAMDRLRQARARTPKRERRPARQSS